MSAQNVTVRPGEQHAETGVSAIASNTRRGAGSAPLQDERELPLSLSPPLSVAGPPAAERCSGAGVHLRLYGDLDEVADTWKAFERHADRTVFQSFDWLAAWQRHIGAERGTVPAIITGRDGDGELLFILQLAIETGRSGRCLAWLGSQLCDYNAPLLAEQFSDRMSAERFALAWRDAIALMRADPRFRFDMIDLQKMPEMIGGQRNPFLDLAVSPHPSGAYVASLGRSWEEFYAAKRSASTRKRERRQLKQLAEHGEVRFVDVEDGAEIERTLATLFEQKSRAFARMGVDNLLARPGRREFFQAIAADPEMRELVHVSRLDVGTTMAAINIGLTFRDCYYLILSSYDDGDLSRFGPGRAHLNELLQHAIARGFARFDFTVGDEPYKRDWSDIELSLFDHLAAVTPRGYAVMAMTGAFRRTKRFIKQSPTLWPAFSKARALAGLLSPR